MGAAMIASDFRSLSRQPPADPDIQTTLSDFLTYTEHFPSHLTRALSLIEDQRMRTEQKIKSVHDDTSTWSLLPTIKNGRPDPATLRRDISYALEEAERASRMALEEAMRLDETCARESKHLDVVVEKLKAQPLPPSRDPTPPPQQQTPASPNLKRERRLSVRADEGKPEKPTRKLDDKAATKLRGRKIMVPGEVLPPPDPNVPPESVSDWTTPRQISPIEEEEAFVEKEKEKKTATPRPRSRTPKPPKSEKDRKTPKPRVPRAPGQPGTNAHSAVAGISTSNALLALTAPPPEAAQGSRWLPWMALTEWEMAKLRKRMKKNAIWVPSQTMVRRELKALGRGIAGRDLARKKAEEGGPEFVDEPNMPDPTKTVISGEDNMQTTVLLDDKLYAAGGDADDQDQELINRGMRLNEAKKLKRQRMMEEQALQAQILREQGIEPPPAEIPGSPELKKRKREPTPTAGPSTVTTEAAETASDTTIRPGSKRIKLSTSNASSAGTTKIPLAPAGVSSSPTKASLARQHRTATPPNRARKPTLVLKAGKSVSEEPPDRRATLRRSSNASLPSTSNLPPSSPRGGSSGRNMRPSTANSTGTTRRHRRPAPGILTSADAESASVSLSTRKAAPRKKNAAARAPSSAVTEAAAATSAAELSAVEDDVDPDEPRYCLCGDVSWGTMIACDNDDCEKEWFHLSCVNLSELPPRRTKWYCPDCRKKLKVGLANNGLVGRMSLGGPSSR